MTLASLCVMMQHLAFRTATAISSSALRSSPHALSTQVFMSILFTVQHVMLPTEAVDQGCQLKFHCPIRKKACFLQVQGMC